MQHPSLRSLRAVSRCVPGETPHSPAQTLAGPHVAHMRRSGCVTHPKDLPASCAAATVEFMVIAIAVLAAPLTVLSTPRRYHGLDCWDTGQAYAVALPP